MNSSGGARNEEIQLHPTVKPVAMIVDAIKDVSKRNGIVLDLFGGSGSTLIAAHKTGRRGYLCELDPLYCDRIIRRWQIFAKDDAILATTGQSFEETAVNRRNSPPGLEPIDQSIISPPPLVTDYGRPAIASPGATAENHLVCWLPPFHPVFARMNQTSGNPPLRAAE